MFPFCQPIFVHTYVQYYSYAQRVQLQQNLELSISISSTYAVCTPPTRFCRCRTVVSRVASTVLVLLVLYRARRAGR
jgi:hypothetical protein